MINRGPSTPLKFKLLEEVWSSKKVDLSYLKVSDCAFYVHIDSIARSKLDAKSKKCFFVGYGDSEFGYRLWDNQNQRIIRRKDVINEAILYKDRDSSSEAKKPEVIPLKDLLETKGENSGIEDQETKAPEESQTTPIVA